MTRFCGILTALIAAAALILVSLALAGSHHRSGYMLENGLFSSPPAAASLCGLRE